ncbi:hypothetical protein AAK967_09130, partial [Atopobiaceae bacterium 24-176]
MRRTAPAPSATPVELKVLLWAAAIIAAWCLLVFGAQAAGADRAAANAAITDEVCLAHARADGWDL